MVVVLNLMQWWGSGVVVLKGLCVWGYRRLVRSLVLRTCLTGLFFCPLLSHTQLDRVSMLLCVKCRYLYLSAHCDTASLIKEIPDSLLKGA